MLRKATVDPTSLGDGDYAPFIKCPKCSTTADHFNQPTLCTFDTAARAAKIRREKPDLWVSIHTNAAGDPGIHGTELFLNSKSGNGAKSLAFAKLLLNRQAQLGLDAAHRYGGLPQDTTKKSNVLDAPGPGALTELAYHTNYQFGIDQAQETDLDEYKLHDPAFRAAAALAIVDAIKTFFATK